MTERIVGYVLLLVGIGLMIYPVVSVFQVFTGRSKPIVFFQSVNPNTKPNNTKSNQKAWQQLLLQLPKEQQQFFSDLTTTNPLESVINSQAIDEGIRLTLHFFLMSFLLGFGYKLASLGVMFVRPIKVSLRQTTNQENN